MSEFSIAFNQLEQQIIELIKKKENLETETNQLNEKCFQLEKELENKQIEIEKLEDKNKILRIAGGTNKGDQREIKLKINEIVREVDKCIAQLNQ